MNDNQPTRTEYSAKNTSMAIVSKVIAIIMGYVTRIVFIKYLSQDYVGVNGLFTDIINVLALSELGLNTAITYALFKPIANKDYEKIKSIMALYKKLYIAVAGFVAVAGLAIIPFFDVIMKSRPNVDNLVFIYLLYLMGSVSSYLLVYKCALIEANQMSYIRSFFNTAVYLVQYIIQIILLVVTHNFILYLVTNILATLILNILLSVKANKLFPYIREKNVTPLDKESKTALKKNIGAMFIHRLGSIVVDNTDNLIMSSMIGVIEVGIYSNYYLIIASVRQIFDQFMSALTASVGNLAVTSDDDTVKKIFEGTHFLGQWVYGMATICLYELLNDFIVLSFGEEYLFGKEIVLILCINFFVRGICKATLVFRDSIGLFWADRYKSIFEAVINLVVSIILVQKIGIVGIFLGTLASTLLTTFWVEPLVFYRHIKKSPLRFFLKTVLYIVVWCPIWFGIDKLCGLYTGGIVGSIFVKFGICVALSMAFQFLIYFKTEEFKTLWEKMLLIFDKLKAKFARKKA